MSPLLREAVESLGADKEAFRKWFTYFDETIESASKVAKRNGEDSVQAFCWAALLAVSLRSQILGRDECPGAVEEAAERCRVLTLRLMKPEEVPS